MSTFLYAILGFILAIGLLTTVHEYGHFLVARLLRIKVLRFSVGFGKPIFSWYDKRGTEYAIGAIPLGGYVKMLDQNEAKVPPNEVHLAFNRKPVWMRMLVIAAGPIFNLLFAILAYWVVFMWGVSSVMPILGDIPTNSIAYNAGLRNGQQIIAVDDTATSSWEDIIMALAGHLGDEDKATVTVRDADNQITTHTLDLNNVSLDNPRTLLLSELGLDPYDPFEPVVEKLVPNMPAAAEGMEPGDKILSVDGQKVASRTQFMQAIRNKYDQNVHLIVQRGDHKISIILKPIQKTLDNGQSSGFIGVQFTNPPWPANLIQVQRYNPLQALVMGYNKTIEYTKLTFQFLGKMLTGKMSLQHVAGPISIAKFAGKTFRTGVEYFLSFLALVSISLGVLNMLPIPILDGGHLLFCVIELVRGKALSQRAMYVGHIMGFVLLGWFMILALYNDFSRILQ